MKEIDYERSENPAPEKKRSVSWSKKVLPLRTYEGDVKELMSEGNITKTSIVVAEQKKKEQKGEENTSGSLGKAIVFLFLLCIFLSLTAWYILFGFDSKAPTVPQQSNSPQTETTPEILRNETITIDGDSRAQLIADLRIFLEKYSTEIGVKPITLLSSGNTTSWQELLFLISPSSPKEFGHRNHAYSIGARGSIGEIFLIAESINPEEDLAALLEWEANMIIDLPGVFSPRTPTEVARSYSELRFKDEFVANSDARVARKVSGDSVFIYGYIDSSHILFASSIQTYQLISELFRSGEITI